MADGAGATWPLEEPGLWVERLGGRNWRAGRPALFLDRDGTINEDTGYPSDPAQIVLRPDMAQVVQAANASEIPVIVVTNQSGIARGYFGWAEFSAVNRRVLDLLAASGGRVDLVLACAYHDAGTAPYGIADHPMRKPNPGMLLRAGELLDLDLSRSIIVGDKMADMEAGRRAGLAAGWLVGFDPEDSAGFPVSPLQAADDLANLLAAIADFAGH